MRVKREGSMVSLNLYTSMTHSAKKNPSSP
jgi:hypothetical protein